jgi:hypothetical protein
VDIDSARAHLVASIYLQMSIKPHIVHIVGHTEADHAATAKDIIQASKLARRAIDNALAGQPDMRADPLVQERQEQLVEESTITMQSIRALGGPGVKEPLIDPTTLSSTVDKGILDAPQLRNNPFARGKIKTRIIKGACIAIDSSGRQLSEKERIANLEVI